MSATQEVGEIFGAGKGPAHAMLRSPTVLIASIGLWGMNIYFFRVFGIDYVKVLKHDLLKMEEQEDILNNSQDYNNGGSSNRRTNRGRHIARKDSETQDADSYSENGTTKGGTPDAISDDEEVAIMESPLEDSISDEVTASRLVLLSLTLLVVLHGTYSFWIDWMGGGSIGAIFAFYGAVTTAILFPLQSMRWLRHGTLIVLQRAYELINPRCHFLQSTCVSPIPDDGIIKALRPIPFVDVFFADAMCSLSKVFFDWGMLFHMAFYYPNPVPMSAWNILIPSAFAAVPFVIRARQCLVMWSFASLKNDPDRFQHLWNALKYSTSIFPLCLSAYQKTVMKERAHELEVYLILLLIINAAYALWWDVVMDWGMMKNPQLSATFLCNPVTNLANGNGSYSAVPSRDHMEHRPIARQVSGPLATTSASPSCWYVLLRNRLRFGVGMSMAILVTDVILRFSWVLRFYHKLFPSGDSFVLCSQFLEVVRRALWTLLRVEWENLKQSGHHRTGSVKPLTATVQLVSITDDEKSSFLSRGSTANLNKFPHASKITVEKNAEA